MDDMITIATGFQSSINIAYDLNDAAKLHSYIPTQSALNLLEEVLRSTRQDATDRSRILIGAYGKGKSHIVLMILSILMKKDLSLFSKMMPVIKTDRPELYQLIQEYYESSTNILPVVVSGSSNSVSQAFTLALKRTLEQNELNDVMPETNYEAAVQTILKWKNEFPETYKSFSDTIGDNVTDYMHRLMDFDPTAYEQFEKLYPTLTAGSTFDPYTGFDVPSLYETVLKALKSKGITGLYVVFDEFNKYLENHIKDASKDDTKILQDFSERCSRSGKNQIHLILISHKEITSYIEGASQDTINGWRGVSERFKNIYLNNNFNQTYEIIAAAIEKNSLQWNAFKTEHESDFKELMRLYDNSPLFSDLGNEGLSRVIYDCYPLHPVSTFILPRVSELVAQNERTLFTFISSNGKNTLAEFLSKHDEKSFLMVTPDLIFDYFEPLLRQQIYSGNQSRIYRLASSVLRTLEEGSLERKIVKSLALIYIIEYFEKLRPTIDVLNGIYYTYGADAVTAAITRLKTQENVIYQNQSNGFLRLKETSGVDIQVAIADMKSKLESKFDLKQTLNSALFDAYFYPSRYNDERDMTRYFQFRFIHCSEVTENVNWEIKKEQVHADGVMFAVIPDSQEELRRVSDLIFKTSENSNDCVFILPREYTDVTETAKEYAAVDTLMQAADNSVLADEYQIVKNDLLRVLRDYVTSYTRPERGRAVYIYRGEKQIIYRKTDLSELLSKICDITYGLTPVINNEMINKEEPTSVACNSRKKITSALLRNDLEKDLGLPGRGQEVAIMRSTLIRTGVLEQSNKEVKINLKPADANLTNMLGVIQAFILSAKSGSVSFDKLYRDLTSSENHIGLRKGLIPIYLAAALHVYRREVVINSQIQQETLSSDLLEQINAVPENFSLMFIDWNEDKERYLKKLQCAFCAAKQDQDLDYNQIGYALRKWFMALPKYTKELTKNPDGSLISKECRAFIKAMKGNAGSYELLFRILPDAFDGKHITPELADKIHETKIYLDSALDNQKQYLVEELKKKFCTVETAVCEKMSLTSVVQDWCENLDPAVFEQIFNDGTDRFLNLMRGITNDELLFVSDAAREITGLHIEDWDGSTAQLFLDRVDTYRNNAENFHHEEKSDTSSSSNAKEYALSYVDGNGNQVVKRFAPTEISPRGKLLYNMVESQITSMGESISEIEKRQVLMEILKGMC